MTPIERLLAQLHELDRFDSDVARRRQAWNGWVARIAPLAAAACLLFMLRTPSFEVSPRTALAGLSQVRHVPFESLSAYKRVDAFETCARRDGFVMVLLRAWNEECACMAWRLHEEQDGRRMLQLHRGDTLRLSIDVSENPAVEQLLIFALSDRDTELPYDPDAADELLACLNTNAPPVDPADDAAYALALDYCLPSDVRVLTRPFTVD